MPTPRTNLGSRGERLARAYLEEKGYHVLEINYRCLWGELDIIARDGDDIVFTEVRTRRGSKYGGPEESLTEGKMQHLIAASQHYLQAHGLQNSSWRIDLVCVQISTDCRLESIKQLEHAVQE